MAASTAFPFKSLNPATQPLRRNNNEDCLLDSFNRNDRMLLPGCVFIIVIIRPWSRYRLCHLRALTPPSSVTRLDACPREITNARS